MFNSHPFNTQLFNGGFANNEVFSMDRLVFDGFSLSGSPMTLTRLLDSGASREFTGGAVPRGDGEFITAINSRERIVEAEGIVTQATKELLAAYLKSIQRRLRTKEGHLDITDDDGVVRRYVATLDNFDELFAGRESYHITFCPWKARFRCKTPFGHARAYESLSSAVTSSPNTQSVVNEGTEETDQVVTLNFDSASSVTTVNLKNETTGEEIECAPDGGISATDVLVFNGERKEVLLNGEPIDWSGSFPKLEVGANLMKTTLDGTFSCYRTHAWRPAYQ